MIKTYKLMKLEELGILFRDKKGGWYVSAGLDGVDLTNDLLKAGMFTLKILFYTIGTETYYIEDGEFKHLNIREIKLLRDLFEV